MLAIIFVPFWYGYMASRRGRNVVGWGVLGIIIFVVLKGIVTLIAVSAHVSSQSQATSLTVILNIILLGGTFFSAFAIPQKKEITDTENLTSALSSKEKEHTENSVLVNEEYECSECNTAVKEEDKICPHCGAQLDDNEED